MGGQDKLFCYLNGVPVLALTLQALDRCELIDEIVIAARQESILKIGDLCRDYAIEKPVKIVEGGANRVQSVMNAALSAAPDAAGGGVGSAVRIRRNVHCRETPRRRARAEAGMPPGLCA